VTTARGRLGSLAHSSWLGESLLEVATAKAGLGDPAGGRAATADALENLYATVGHNTDGVRRAEALRDTLASR
jgi:hypothetical protein